VIHWLDNTVIPSYFLDVDLTPSVCGNGVTQIGEQCDDGNGVDGDGCSAVCLAENAVQEVEPNATSAEADAAGINSDGTTLFGGAIGTVGDVDRFRVDLAAPSFIRFETFTSIDDCSANNAMTLRVFDAANNSLVTDGLGGIFSGIQSCAAITFPLPAGTFYVQVEESGNNALLPSYLLEVQSQADFGTETEPNEDIATASLNIQAAGSNVYVFGDHTLNADSDYYAIDVPEGASVRLETIEGDRAVETCESNGVDSRITLYTAGGAQIADNDDEGRGWCSLIDGTGTVALHPGAHGLAAGTYYAQVRQSASANVAGGQFIYRLVATVREP
jgi:cysteine-rich repeat protein